MATKARAKAASGASIRQFDLSAELRATADRRKKPEENGHQSIGLSWSHESIPEIAQRLSELFPSLSVDVVNAVLSDIFRANPHYSRQRLASDAVAVLLEMCLTSSGPQSMTSFEPAHTIHTDATESPMPSATENASDAQADVSMEDAASLETEVEYYLDEQLAALLALDETSLLICLKTLVSAFHRINERPTDARVRRLRRGNARFHTEVGCHEPALELLRIAGFREEGLDEGDPSFVFHGCPATSKDFLSVQEALVGVLEAFSEASASATQAVDAPSKTSRMEGARRHIAEITEHRLRNPHAFREAARASGAANRASGKGYMIKADRTKPQIAPDRRAQHFTLADVERMRVADEIANTPSYAEEYQRSKQSTPVRDLLSLAAREYDPELLGRRALDLTNRYRASKGLPPCRWHAGIARIAAEHATQMASGAATFSHDGFDERVRAFPVAHRSAAENLAYNKGIHTVAEAAVDGWIKSPGHEKNLRGTSNLCGIGVARAPDGSFYLTQLFALAV